MKAPTNTTREMNDDPRAGLRFLREQSATGCAIENQEARGQDEFVKSDTLPTDIRPEAKAALEAAGAKFLGPVPGDDVFQYATLPPGWTKKAGKHSMWSDLVDDKGRKRGGIFYKAAFYDRSANLSLVRRYNVRIDYDRGMAENVAVARVLDGETVIHETDPLPQSDKYWNEQEEATKTAREWLLSKYPEADKFEAYWD